MTAITGLAGGVFQLPTTDSDTADLRQLVDDLGRRSSQERSGAARLPEQFDSALWRRLEETGLSRLTSTPDLGAGPAELAIVLRGLAHHSGAVPIAETDLLAAWLGDLAGLILPEDGPLTIAIADSTGLDGRLSGTAVDVPWALASDAVVLAVRAREAMYVAVVEPGELNIESGHNLAGEPRDTVRFDLPADRFRDIPSSVADELFRRGAWARCAQIIGVLDAAASLTVAHTRDRVQFGRPLSAFQAVQQSLATMAGEIERGRAAATLAVAAASDHGFAAHQTDYAVTVTKAILGSVVDTVVSTAHQLHGALGVTLEHPLWRSTMRAQSWISEFGSTREHARHLGRLAVHTDHPWDVVAGILS